MFAFGHEIMVNDCLLPCHEPLPTYPKRAQIFDFDRPPAYNAALPTSHPDRIPKRDRMAGHSQFKNIMHRKGRQDAQKSKLFSKLAREITVAAKMGTPDPSMNARRGAPGSTEDGAAGGGGDRRPPGEHATRQYRARHQEGDRQRRRELR